MSKRLAAAAPAAARAAQADDADAASAAAPSLLDLPPLALEQILSALIPEPDFLNAHASDTVAATAGLAFASSAALELVSEVWCRRRLFDPPALPAVAADDPEGLDFDDLYRRLAAYVAQHMFPGGELDDAAEADPFGMLQMVFGGEEEEEEEEEEANEPPAALKEPARFPSQPARAEILAAAGALGKERRELVSWDAPPFDGRLAKEDFAMLDTYQPDHHGWRHYHYWRESDSDSDDDPPSARMPRGVLRRLARVRYAGDSAHFLDRTRPPPLSVAQMRREHLREHLMQIADPWEVPGLLELATSQRFCETGYLTHGPACILESPAVAARAALIAAECVRQGLPEPDASEIQQIYGWFAGPIDRARSSAAELLKRKLLPAADARRLRPRLVEEVARRRRGGEARAQVWPLGGLPAAYEGARALSWYVKSGKGPAPAAAAVGAQAWRALAVEMVARAGDYDWDPEAALRLEAPRPPQRRPALRAEAPPPLARRRAQEAEPPGPSADAAAGGPRVLLLRTLAEADAWLLTQPGKVLVSEPCEASLRPQLAGALSEAARRREIPAARAARGLPQQPLPNVAEVLERYARSGAGGGVPRLGAIITRELRVSARAAAAEEAAQRARRGVLAAIRRDAGLPGLRDVHWAGRRGERARDAYAAFVELGRGGEAAVRRLAARERTGRPFAGPEFETLMAAFQRRPAPAAQG